MSYQEFTSLFLLIYLLGFHEFISHLGLMCPSLPAILQSNKNVNGLQVVAYMHIAFHSSFQNGVVKLF